MISFTHSSIYRAAWLLVMLADLMVPTTTTGQTLLLPPAQRSMSGDSLDMVQRTLLYHDNQLLTQQGQLQHLERQLNSLQDEVDRWESAAEKRYAEQGRQIGGLSSEQGKLTERASSTQGQLQELQTMVEQLRKSLKSNENFSDEAIGLVPTGGAVDKVTLPRVPVTTRREIASFKVTTQSTPARLMEVDGRFLIALERHDLELPVVTAVPCRRAFAVVNVKTSIGYQTLIWHPCDKSYSLLHRP